MVNLKIRSVSISLPYPPYPAQIITMSKIITSLQEGTSALIESPTGTGKTFSILCSVLAYLESDTCFRNSKGERPRVYICSRTHKQIDQIISSLKMTRYQPSISILASRTQFCVNKALSNVMDKNTACTDLLKRKGCDFFLKRDDLAEKLRGLVLDVEEIKSKGRRCKGCPFYASRILQETSSVTFAPYNYLVDPAIRRSMNIDVKDGIVIVDEAHNIEDFCRGAGSLCLSSGTIDIMVNELHKIMKIGIDPDTRLELCFILSFMRIFKEYAECSGSFNVIKRTKNEEVTRKLNAPDDYNFNLGIRNTSSNRNKADYNNIVNSIINNNNDINHGVETDNSINNNKVFNNSYSENNSNSNSNTFVLNKGFKSKDMVLKGREIVDFLISISIRHEICIKLRKSINISNKNEILSSNTIQILESLTMILEIIFCGNPEAYAFGFEKKNDDSYKYDFWLLDPSVIFNPLARSARSIILLSGTLTPFKSFTTELGFYFKHTVEAPHVVEKSNIFVGVIKKGHLNKDLLGKYANLESLEYLNQLKEIILGARSKVGTSGGTLVFVPSYAFLENLTLRIGNKDFIIKEPRNNSLFDNCLKAYNRGIQDKKGPILICVFRGRAAEGIDFKDEYARAVIAIGIPYPSFKDKEVVSKREFNDKFKNVYVRTTKNESKDNSINEKKRNKNNDANIYETQTYNKENLDGNIPNKIIKTSIDDPISNKIINDNIQNNMNNKISNDGNNKSMNEINVVSKTSNENNIGSIEIKSNILNTTTDSLNNSIKLNKRHDSMTSRMTGSEWYETQAFRAVNQAIGRVMRHKNDWGGVFLVDCRYAEKRNTKFISKWVCESIKIYEKSNECIEDFKWFVKKKIQEEKSL